MKAARQKVIESRALISNTIVIGASQGQIGGSLLQDVFVDHSHHGGKSTCEKCRGRYTLCPCVVPSAAYCQRRKHTIKDLYSNLPELTRFTGDTAALVQQEQVFYIVFLDMDQLHEPNKIKNNPVGARHSCHDVFGKHMISILILDHDQDLKN